MAITFQKDTLKGKTPAIWRGEAKVLPAGFKPKQTFANGVVIKRGTPVFVDYSDMSAAVVKASSALAGGTTKAVRVCKDHYFSTGDAIMKVGADSKTSVTAIDTTNADYDVLTLASAITGLAEGDVLVEASASAAEAAYAPNAVVAADVEFKGKGIPTIDAAYEAVVLTPNVAYPVLDSWLNGFCLKSNPNILFIKQ